MIRMYSSVVMVGFCSMSLFNWVPLAGSRLVLKRARICASCSPGWVALSKLRYSSQDRWNSVKCAVVPKKSGLAVFMISWESSGLPMDANDAKNAPSGLTAAPACNEYVAAARASALIAAIDTYSNLFLPR